MSGNNRSKRLVDLILKAAKANIGLLILLFVLFFPLVCLILDYYLVDNFCDVQLNNYSSGRCFMTVTTSLGKKEFSVEPFEKKADIVRVYKGLPAVIKVTDNKKRILYQNIYDFDSVDSKRCESGKRNGRILTVNIPDDGILDKIFSPDSYKAIPSSDEKPEKGGVEKNSEKPQRYRNSDVSKIYTDQKRHEFYLIAHEDHTGLPSSRRTLFEKVSRTYHADRHPTSQNYWNRGQIGDRGNAHELRYGFI